MSKFTNFHQIYINSAQLPLNQIFKSEVTSQSRQNSVFELQNEEFTKNAMRAKFGDYQIQLHHPIQLESITLVFTTSNSSDIYFNSNYARRLTGDISNIIPVPSFLLSTNIQVFVKSKIEKFNIVSTQQPCLLNDWFFAIGDILGVYFKHIKIWMPTAFKLFEPTDYAQLFTEFSQYLNLKKELNILVDSQITEIHSFQSWAVVPLINTEKMTTRKTLELYQICAEAISRVSFNLSTNSLINKRSCFILQELSKIKLDQQYLSQSEISWDFVQTQTSFSVFCNASMPQLWSSAIFEQREVTADMVDQMLKLGFRQRPKTVQNVKWSSLNLNVFNNIPKVFLRDEALTQMNQEKKLDIDRLQRQKDFNDNQSEISIETNTIINKIGQQPIFDDWVAEDYLFQDQSYPYQDDGFGLKMLRLRAKIIALTIFNNTEDTDSILCEYYQNGEFTLQAFLQTLDELQNSQLCSTQAVGAGPDVSHDQHHQFQNVQAAKTHTQQKTQQLTGIIGQLGYCLQAPRVIIQEVTDQSGGNKKTQFKLNLTNYSPSNMFADFIQQKLQIFDGAQIIDKKIDKFEKSSVSQARVYGQEDTSRMFSTIDICAINNNHSVLPCLDPKMSLPFLSWSRWMQSDQQQLPHVVNILDSEIKPDSDAQTPYISVIHRAFTLTKYYYEPLLPRLFEILNSKDFRIRETGIIGIYRFFSTYSSFKFQEKSLQIAIQEHFQLLESPFQDVIFALNCLFDQTYFKRNLQGMDEGVLALTATLLGYISIKNMDIFYQLIEWDYGVQSQNNVVSCCALQGIAWQLQQHDNSTFTRNEEVYLKAFETFKAILQNINNSGYVRQSIVYLLGFLCVSLDYEKIHIMLKVFDHTEQVINCDCSICRFDFSIIITFFLQMADSYPELRESVLFSLRGLFMSHIPSYDQNTFFMSYIDPEFLLILARPGDQILSKSMHSLSCLSISPSLDWLIRDAYRNTHQVVENQFHILYDCQFCYLGGSCTCTRVNRQKDEFQPIIEQLRYTKDSYKQGDIFIDASFQPALEKTCINSYKRISSYTTDESSNHDPTQQAAPELGPLTTVPYSTGEEWIGSFCLRMSSRCSAGCLVGRDIVENLLGYFNKSQSRVQRLQVLKVISEAIGCGYYAIKEQTESQITEGARNVLSRTFAAIRAAEEEASSIQAGRIPTVRVFEEELNSWILLQADPGGYQTSDIYYGPMRLK
eukprot:EST43941.1 Hypothetical protein SS50377_16243 [Spironucleus salmonicida]